MYDEYKLYTTVMHYIPYLTYLSIPIPCCFMLLNFLEKYCNLNLLCSLNSFSCVADKDFTH